MITSTLKKQLFLISSLVLVGCTSDDREVILPPDPNNFIVSDPVLTPAPMAQFESRNWSMFTDRAASHYGIDKNLIKAIIHVESGGNPKAVSSANAIGLMQIKAVSAGREIYRLRGQYRDPSSQELKNPAINIDIGSAYIKYLQDTELVGITDPLTLRYATIVSYCNGAGALLRIFSRKRQNAIDKINAMTPQQFYYYVLRTHPAAQAPQYLVKVTHAYQQS